MKIEEDPFFIIKDYRKIVGKAKNESPIATKFNESEFTTHESIPQNVKNQINQILLQLTQPQKFNDENQSRFTDYDAYMDEQGYFYFESERMQKR